MQKILAPLLTFLAVVFAATTYYFYTQTVRLTAQLTEVRQSPGKFARAETEELVLRVGSLIELPAGEIPTVATVADPEKLRPQAFFAQAKVGDRVLIYTNARRAILYDPVSHKILEVAPVSFEPPGGR